VENLTSFTRDQRSIFTKPLHFLCSGQCNKMLDGLTRTFLLGRGRGSAKRSAIFRPSWQALPNLFAARCLMIQGKSKQVNGLKGCMVGGGQKFFRG
jgi:hypothetical protein